MSASALNRRMRETEVTAGGRCSVMAAELKLRCTMEVLEGDAVCKAPRGSRVDISTW